jgi:SagB-type dehydrogenase family enzyme
VAAALGQEVVASAPVVFVLTGVIQRTERKYGSKRAPRYVMLEAGHAAQNLLLEATALGLGGTPVGAFDDAAVLRVLGLAGGELPLYLVPVGVPR